MKWKWFRDWLIGLVSFFKANTMTVEKILIVNYRKYKPVFGIIEVDHIDEIQQERPEIENWSFDVHLKDGRVKRLCFEDQKEAEYVYLRVFDMLAIDRGG